jgi:2-amino-4-hydroxy-6-hydroxymethyldihydropteridine diphosphokinase
MRVASSPVCLLLGSNIEPEKNLALALAELHRSVQVAMVSNAWETPAVGSEGPNFLNAAVLIHSASDPHALKTQVLRPLEQRLGRKRTEDKFAPRPIDIDIVYWGGAAMELELWRHAHMAVPTAELLPNLRSPETGERLESAARRLMSSTPIRMHHAVLVPGNLQRRTARAPSYSLN